MRKRVVKSITLFGLLCVMFPAWADEADEVLRLGSKALVGQDMDQAISYFSQAQRMVNPSRLQLVTAHSGLCAAYYKKSMLDKDMVLTRKAIVACDSAIALKSDHQSALRMRGIAHLTTGIFDRAVEDLNVAIALRPDDYLAIQNRGLAKAKLGQSSEAIQDFDLSIKLKPNHPWGYYNRGRLQAALFEDEKAVDDFSTFIRFKQGFESVYLHRGLSQMRLGHYQQAVGDFYEVIRLQTKENPSALANRGIALYLLGRYQEAAEDFEAAVKLDGQDMENRFWFYLVRERLRRPSPEILLAQGGGKVAKSWPGVMAAYLLGHVPSQEVLDVIRQTTDSGLRAERESLTHFIFGEWSAIKGRPDVARKWFDIIVNKAGPRPPWYHAASQQRSLMDSAWAKEKTIEPVKKSWVEQTAEVSDESTSELDLAGVQEWAGTSQPEKAEPEQPTPTLSSINRQEEFGTEIPAVEVGGGSSSLLAGIGSTIDEDQLPSDALVVKPVVAEIKPAQHQKQAAVEPIAKAVESTEKPWIAKGGYPHKPGAYAFKVASFQDQENADEALAEVVRLGYSAYLQEIEIKGSRYLRVWVGPFDTLEEADRARDEVKKIPGREPSRARLR
ncbi:MAG: tetratricopeptide repeat protein [Magnetococcales bacterium]|nr:tetratricopeptide repeat protein [Magnetococcales bacterium]